MPPRGTHRRRQGLCAASRRLDRRASRPFAEGRTVSCRHRGAAARRSRTGSCIAPASAARCGPKPATAASGFSASPAAPSISTAACTITSSAKRARICRRPSQAYAEALGVKVKRLSIRDQSSRWGSCTSAGSLSFSWRLILAPPYVLDYLAAHEVAHLVEMNHSARFWRVVAQGLRPCRARQDLARYPRQRPASLRDRGLSRLRCPDAMQRPSPGCRDDSAWRVEPDPRRSTVRRTADPSASHRARRRFRTRRRIGGARRSAAGDSRRLTGSARAEPGLARMAAMRERRADLRCGLQQVRRTAALTARFGRPATGTP